MAGGAALSVHRGSRGRCGPGGAGAPRPRRLEDRVEPWPGCEGGFRPLAVGANGAVAPDPPRGRSHQQLRLKILSRREKLGFMASDLRRRWTTPPPRRRLRLEAVRTGATSSRGRAHRWSAPPPCSPEGPGLPARAAQALGGVRLRVARATSPLPPPSPAPPQLAARQPGKAIYCEIWRCRETRAAQRPCRGDTRGGSGGLPAGPRRAGLRRSSPFLFAGAPSPGHGRRRALSRLSSGSPATGAKLREDPAVAAGPLASFLPAGDGGGAARLPRRRAVFVLGAVPQRRHGEPEAVPAKVGPVPLAVAVRAAAAGEGGGALQKLQLSDCEERC